jgi:hypothetical protein
MRLAACEVFAPPQVVRIVIEVSYKAPIYDKFAHASPGLGDKLKKVSHIYWGMVCYRSEKTLRRETVAKLVSTSVGSFDHSRLLLIFYNILSSDYQWNCLNQTFASSFMT